MGERRFTTRYQIQEEGGDQLRRNLRRTGTEAEDSFERMERASREASRGLTAVDTTSRTLQSGLSGLRTGAIAVAGALAGITGGFGLREIVGNLAEFGAEFNNVRTLIDESAVSSSNLRRQLLALPPVLGDSASLARGLYSTLSAGVAPAEAVRFVGEAARFARTGLLETSEAVDVATTIINGFGLASSDAAKVFDRLFQTVRLGKTTGQDIARFLGPVIPLAEGLGIKFDEVLAAYATLTRTLRPTTAADALKSLFSQLSQNADKFRAVGVDLTDVIGGNGLAGAMKALADETGGNSEAIGQLITDQNAIIAAQQLAGIQAETYADQLRQIGGADGSVLEGFTKQTEGLQAAWEELANTWDRAIQNQGTQLNSLLEGITRGVTELIKPLTQTRAEKLAETIAVLQENIARREAGGGFLDTFLFNLDNARERLSEFQRELGLLRQAETPDPHPEEIVAAYEREVEEFKVKEDRKKKLEEQATAARNRILDAEQEAREKAAKAAADAAAREEKRITDNLDREAARRIAIVRQNLEDRISAENHAARTIAGLRQRQIDEDAQRQQKIVDDFLDIRAKAERQSIADDERANEERERLARDAAERINRPFIELSNDITENLSDAIVQGLLGDDIEDALDALSTLLNRSFADFASRLLQQRLFDPIFEQAAQSATEQLSSVQFAPLPGGRGAAPPPTTQGGQIAASSTGGGLSSGALIGIAGGTGAGLVLNQSLGGGQTGSNVISGAGSGALLGGKAFGIFGAIGGAVLGGLVGALPTLLGGGDPQARAAIQTTFSPIPPELASDRATREGPFGFISFVGDRRSTERFDAHAAASFVQGIDEAIADILTDRQEEAVALLLGTQGARPSFAGEDQADVVAQVVFDRMTTILDELSPGLAERLFGSATVASSENLQGLTDTVNDALSFLAAIDSFRNPTEPLSEAEQALAAVNDRFDALAAQVARFGDAADAAVVEQERLLQQQELTTDFDEQIRRELLSFTDPFALELELLEERRQTALDAARTLNGDILQVERRFAEERLAIEERFADRQVEVIERITRRSFDAIDQFLNQTLVSERGGLSLQARLAESERQLQQAFRGTDERALVQAADAQLRIIRDLFGSTPERFERQERLFGLLDQFREREMAADDAAIAAQEQAIAAQEQARSTRRQEILQERQNELLAEALEQGDDAHAILQQIRDTWAPVAGLNGRILDQLERFLAAQGVG